MPHDRIAAEDYLDALAANGIEHLFANPGTDFAPIIEAYARAARSNRKVPRPMVVPHENAAVAMAHGYTAVTSRPQAVMTHTNVGTANAINALIDASRDRIPMLLTSGRTPITESGPVGTRNVYIHWAQEMFDQAGMLREMVKWDYELRRADQIPDVVARAMDIATASPAGPVYLSLPREVLGEPSAAERRRGTTGAVSAADRRQPSDMETLAEWIAAARNPLIITGTLGRDPREATALAELAERYALPVVPFNTRYFALSGAHPMFMGSQPGPLLAQADLVIVWESDVPWYPSQHAPPADARIVQIGEDPLYARYPMRGFPSHLTIRAATLPVLEALANTLAERKPDVAARRDALAKRSAALHAGWAAEAEKGGTGEVGTLAWLNHCLREIVTPETTVISEYSFRQEYCPLPSPGSLVRRQRRGRLGLGIRCGAGGEAGCTGASGDRCAGGWGVYVRQSHRVSFHRTESEPAGAGGGL